MNAHAYCSTVVKELSYHVIEHLKNDSLTTAVVWTQVAEQW